MKIYGMICDNGDGSNSINWFTESPEDLEVLVELDPEGWWCSDGIAQTLTLPEGVTPEELGISLTTIKEQTEWL